MGYSASTATLLQALTSYQRDVRSQNMGSVSLEAHADINALGQQSRFGQLKVLSGGLNADSEYVDDTNFRFLAPAGGDRLVYGAASVRSGPLVIGDIYHVWTSTVAWIRYGTVAITSFVGTSYPAMPYTVYPLYATTTEQYVSVIRDTANGVLYVGRADQ